MKKNELYSRICICKWYYSVGYKMKPTVGKYTIFYFCFCFPFLLGGFALLGNRNTCMSGGLILSIPSIIIILGAMIIDKEEEESKWNHLNFIIDLD